MNLRMKNSRQPLKSVFSVRELTYLALIVAACVVGRILFQPIPNVQPMTAIFLIITVQLGFGRGLIVCLLSVVVTNLYMGMGFWTVTQIASYTVVLALFSGLIRIPIVGKAFITQWGFSLFSGFIYGFVISVIDVQVYGMPAFLPYYLQGLSFDFLHSIGNFVFFLLLTPIFQRLLKRVEGNEKVR